MSWLNCIYQITTTTFINLNFSNVFKLVIFDGSINFLNLLLICPTRSIIVPHITLKVQLLQTALRLAAQLWINCHLSLDVQSTHISRNRKKKNTHFKNKCTPTLINTLTIVVLEKHAAEISIKNLSV